MMTKSQMTPDYQSVKQTVESKLEFYWRESGLASDRIQRISDTLSHLEVKPREECLKLVERIVKRAQLDQEVENILYPKRKESA